MSAHEGCCTIHARFDEESEWRRSGGSSVVRVRLPNDGVDFRRGVVREGMLYYDFYISMSACGKYLGYYAHPSNS
jgi:hypothetical protein